MALVVESWAKVTAMDNYEAVAGELLFRRIFEINVDATAFFSFAKQTADGQIDEETYKNDVFLTHSRAVITTVDAAVDLLKSNSMDTLVTVLRGLGAKHAPMNLEQAHYDLVGQALLDTLAKALGEDHFTAEVKEAWVGVYGVIVEHMMAGAKAQGPSEWKEHDVNAAMEKGMEEIKCVTAEKVQECLKKAEVEALADQDRIQAEVAEEMKRVEEFKERRASLQEAEGN